jgi:hypothetical protein
VVIVPGPSRYVEAWVLVVGLAALAALLAANLPPWAQAPGILLLGASCVRAVRVHAWHEGPGAVRHLDVDLTGRIDVAYASGSPRSGRIAPGSFVAPWLVVLYWNPDGARFARAIVLLPDMAGEQDLRRLRVLLRWGTG